MYFIWISFEDLPQLCQDLIFTSWLSKQTKREHGPSPDSPEKKYPCWSQSIYDMSLKEKKKLVIKDSWAECYKFFRFWAAAYGNKYTTSMIFVFPKSHRYIYLSAQI